MPSPQKELDELSRRQTEEHQRNRGLQIIEGTVPSLRTVPTVATVPSMGTVPFKPGERVYHCHSVQDGHSFAEDRLYNALWHFRQAKTESEHSRLVTLGWDAMGKLAGMTANNARQNCFRLIDKLALEKVQAHISEQRIGTTYRIWSYSAIVRRRKDAGLEWITRNGGGVTFVQGPEKATKGTVPTERTAPREGTDPTEDTVHTEGTASAPSEGTVSVPSVGTLLSHKKVTESQTSSAVGATLRQYGPADDDAVAQLLKACKAAEPTATDEEIVHFIGVKAEQKRRRGAVDNMIGFLLVAVPRCFEGAMFFEYRSMKQRSAERIAAAAYRPDQVEDARRILESAESGALDREWAERVLGDSEIKPRPPELAAGT